MRFQRINLSLRGAIHVHGRRVTADYSYCSVPSLELGESNAD